MKQYLPLAFVTLLLFYSCSHTKKLATKYVPLDTLHVTANKPDTIYRGSAPRIWDITHTRVALSFNMKEKTANGRAWITLHPYFYNTDTLVLEAKSMRIDTIILNKGYGGKLISYDYKGDSIKLRFNRYYAQDDTIQLYVRYTAMPYATSTGGSAAITDDRGLYFINTDYSIVNKPAQIWTQGETESNSHWLPTIDKPNERMTTEVELTVPDSFVTLSNGYLAKHIDLKNGLRTDIWKMDMPIQTYAIMFAIGKFSIIKDSWKGKDVNYYVEPEYAPYARGIFKNTPEMIDYFSRITGVNYPWNKYDQVIVRDYVSGAMENTTASLFGEFMNQNFREMADKDFEDVVSHELFHQWFGDYVTCESWSNITLNESFANYSEQLWRRYKYGDASADEKAIDDLGKYLGYSKYSDQPLVRFHYDDREAVFDPISYEKGGAILNYLHGLMGDKAFYKAMNTYLTKNALHSAEATQWRLAIEEVTGFDWNWFFNEFYYHGGHPVLDVKYHYDDTNNELTVTVTQKNTDSNYVYTLPLKAMVFYGNSSHIEDWNINHKTEKFVYRYKNGEKPVVVPDAFHWLPGSLTDNKKPEQAYFQFNHTHDYINKRKALTTAYFAFDDNMSQLIFHEGLKDTMKQIRAYTLSLFYYQKDTTKAKTNFSTEVKALAISDPSNGVRTWAYDLLAKWKVPTGKTNMMQAINDSSYAVAGAALKGLYILDSIQAYNEAKQLLNTSPRAELRAEIWLIIGNIGNASDITLFENEANYVYGTQKFEFMDGLYEYLINVKNDSSFERGLNVMVRLINTENIKTYRQGLGSLLFELGKDYKERANSKNKESYETIRAIERMPLIKTYIKEVMNNEKEESIRNDYKTLNDELNASNNATETSK